MFSDSLGIEHMITIRHPRGGTIQIVFPVRQVLHIEWHGNGMSSRTEVDPGSTVVRCVFSYEKKTKSSSHGIRIHLSSYKFEVKHVEFQKQALIAEDRFWRTTASQAFVKCQAYSGRMRHPTLNANDFTL